MALTITHAYVATGTDAGNGEVRKSQWNAALNYSGTLDVTNGGTGTTTSTGTGSVVLSDSPALTGNPTAPTATAGDNDTSIATTAFVTTAVAGASSYTQLSNASPGTGATYTVSGLTLTSYKKLYIYFSGISASAGSGFFFTIAGVNSGTLSTAASTVSGYAEIDLNSGLGYGLDGTAVRGQSSSYGITTASTSITFGFTSAGNFDAGNIAIYGVK